ncbi:hypothetical protein TWF694_005617 [Orbilia ellipsospora]|uniref:Uncharacterized protein n=1 Tax=Orbilia ellipsospora TaxID=2528407 RepID=A0AAV9WTV6_9PEZI
MASQDYRQIPAGEEFEDLDLDLEFSPVDNNANEKDCFLRRRRPSFDYTALARSPWLRYGLGFVVLILMSTAFVLGVGLGTLHRRLRDLKSGFFTVQNDPYSPSYRPLLQYGQTIVNFEVEVVDYEVAKRECQRIAPSWRREFYISCNIGARDAIAIRSSVLTCARYAVQAEVGFVLPKLKDKSLNNSLSYIFDEDRFITNIREICPEFPVIRNISDIKNISKGKTISAPGSGKDIQLDTFKKEADRYMNMTATADAPSILRLNLAPYKSNHSSDIGVFSAAFGSLLNPHEDVQILASKILYQLESKLLLDMNLSSSLLQNGTFAAVHLDELLKGYEENTKIYLDTLKELTKQGTNYEYLYVSSTNSSSIDKLRVEASTMNITVLTKWDLLQDVADIEYMEKNLTGEHRKLVDYLVILKSGWFMGSGKSNFSIEMAVNRHKIGRYTKDMTWPRDEWSYVLGDVDESIVAGVWA